MKPWLWTAVFALACGIIYEQSAKKTEKQIVQLGNRFNEIQAEKESALSKQKELMMQINSQSDPAWIELTLMKGLGLVPEGQIKVLFVDEKQ